MAYGETPGGANERLRASTLVGAALGLVRARFQSLAVIALIGLIVDVAWSSYAMPREAELGFLGPLVAGLLAASLGGLLIRSMLTPQGRWWLPDGGFVGYVGLTTVLSLPVSLFVFSMTATPPAPPPPALMLPLLLLLITTLIATVKLALWFVGVLIHSWCGPGDSWRRTNGAVIPYILANLWLTLPPLTLAFLAGGLTGADPTKAPASPGAILFTLFAVVASVLSSSVTAGLWKVRGEG